MGTSSIKSNPFVQSIAKHVIIQQSKNKLPPCGLYIANTDIIQKYPEAVLALPLRHLAYNIQVINHLAKVSLAQTFQNTSSVFIQAQYSFPIDPKIVIHQFRAKFGDVIVSGEVKEKQKAKEEYHEGLAQGRQVAYGEIDANSYDIMNLKIGNIPPKSVATIQIEFIQQLQIEMNTLYKLRIPSTITPRYINQKEQMDQSWAIKILNFLPTFQSNANYTWEFKLKLQSFSPLTFNNSNTHQLLQTSINEQKTQASFIMSNTQVPNKDFTFVYSNQTMMNCTMGTNDIKVCAAISFIPKYSQLKADDAFMMMMKDQSLQVDIEKASGQYIFVLDRSGSMSGGRMNKALEALKLFIKSLPPKSIFNIVSFGSRFQSMFESSLQYNDNNLKKALEILEGYSASLGGTQIQAPLRDVFSRKIVDNYLRQVFLLTDGDVSNTNQVIKLVADNVKYSRVHTIGIGNGCSAALIKGCAEKGKGKAIFITDEGDVASSIIGLLQQSLTPIITSFSLDFDPSIVDSIVPNPRSMPFVLKNEPVNFYIIFKQGFKGKTTFVLKYSQSVHNAPYQNSIVVSTENNGLNFPFVDKIVHHKTISVLVDKFNNNRPLEEDILIAKISDLQKQIVDESVKHQVLSPLTAYICVGKKLSDGKYVEFLEKGQQAVLIPQYQSVDYQNANNIPQINLKYDSANMPRSKAQMNTMREGCTLSSIRGTSDLSYNQESVKYINRPIIQTINCSSPPSASFAPSTAFSGNNCRKNKSYQQAQFASSMNFKKQQYGRTIPRGIAPQGYVPIAQSKKSDQFLNMFSLEKQSFSISPTKGPGFSFGRQESFSPKRQMQNNLDQLHKTIPKTSLIDYVISSQKFDGSWQATSELVSRIFNDQSQLTIYNNLIKSRQINPDLVVTIAIVAWMSSKHNTPAYSLLIKKAKTWINKKALQNKLSQQQQSNIYSTLIII